MPMTQNKCIKQKLLWYVVPAIGTATLTCALHPAGEPPGFLGQALPVPVALQVLEPADGTGLMVAVARSSLLRPVLPGKMARLFAADRLAARAGVQRSRVERLQDLLAVHPALLLDLDAQPPHGRRRLHCMQRTQLLLPDLQQAMCRLPPLDSLWHHFPSTSAHARASMMWQNSSSFLPDDSLAGKV